MHTLSHGIFSCHRHILQESSANLVPIQSKNLQGFIAHLDCFQLRDMDLARALVQHRRHDRVGGVAVQHRARAPQLERLQDSAANRMALNVTRMSVCYAVQ